MIPKTESRNVFLLGALVGMCGGIIVGSAATVGLGDRIGALTRQLVDRLLKDQDSIRFELLGQ